ncbi:MAG: permease-like cell division protein FtsX [Oscillospiraceae bacterium]|nr:permease-like cell division protein FtsX [Oscillospiraceae bacterium]
MNKNNIGYLLKEGVRGVFLHGFRSFAAVCVTVACLIIMGSFCLISLNLNVMVSELESENEVLAYIDENYSEAEAKSVGSQINMIANVKNAVFVSREKALEQFVSEQDDASIFEGIDAETLRDRFEVTLVDNTIMKQTVSDIEQINGVVKTSAHYEISDGFQTVRNVLNLTSAVIILVLLVVSLFIISNTVKLALYDRKEEIAIMRMVGATNSFIRLPFIVEGFLLGIIGSVIAFFIEWGVYDLLAERIEAMDTLQLFRIIPFTTVLPFVLVAYLITGFLVGVMGSMLSIRKFLQV